MGVQKVISAIEMFSLYMIYIWGEKKKESF